MPTLQVSLPPLAGDQSLTIGRWRKQAGEGIAAGETLLEAHSEQYDWDIPSPSAGVIAEIRAAAGASVAPGDTLASVATEAGDAPPTPSIELADKPRMEPAATPRISPLAANVARALGVDVGGLPGSGRGGRIVRADVLAASRPTDDTTAPLPEAWGARAARIAAQRRAVPHASHAAALVLDKTDAELRRRGPAWHAREGFALDRLPYLVHAALAALRTAPELNALFTADGIAYRAACHLAVGVPEDADYALRYGVIRHAEQFALVGIARRLHAMRNGGEDDAATFAVRITRGLLATATLSPGQSACLTFGAASARPVAWPSGELRAQTVIHACLTWDARLLDEFAVARFFAEVQRVLDASSMTA